MSRLKQSVWGELRQDFLRYGSKSTAQCDCCDRSVKWFKLWCRKALYEYDEWDCLCSGCAFNWIHEYDDFDYDYYERMWDEQAAN